MVEIIPKSKNLEIPEEGLIVHLKSFGKVKVFQKIFSQGETLSRKATRCANANKNGEPRYCIIFLPEAEEDALIAITRVEFKALHSIHWGIECYHRAIKQVCGIEQRMVGTTEAIKTHFFSAIRAFTQLELMRAKELIKLVRTPKKFISTAVLVTSFWNTLNNRWAWLHIVHFLSMRKS